nr:putative gag protein [Danio rerio]
MEPTSNNNNALTTSESSALPDTPAAAQRYTAPQTKEPEADAPVRGRRPIRAATTQRRQISPSPITPSRHLPSPASSYASARSSSHVSNKITIPELRKNLSDAGIHIPPRCNKADLLKLYSAIAPQSPPTMDAARSSRSRHAPQTTPTTDNARSSRSRHAPYPQHSTSQTELSHPGQSKKATQKSSTTSKKASRPHIQESRTTPAISFQHTETPLANISTISHANQPFTTSLTWPPAPHSSSTPSPPLHTTAISHSHSQPPIPNLPRTSTQLIHTTSSSIHNAQPLSNPFTLSSIPPYNPPPSLHQALTHSSSTDAAQHPTVPSQISSSHPPYNLFTANLLPVPHNATVLEPPPVSNAAKNLILSGADIDLSSLLSPITPPTAERQVDCGEFTLTLKSSNTTQSRTLSLAEFQVAFSRFTDIICSVFPHRRRELNDYMAIISELALSYGGTHFYTYHKLFSAKCAIRVTQWNQCPYWGALDTDLHNRVFLGCRNLSCAVCRSCLHPTTSCPFIIPSSDKESPNPRSTSYVPRPSTSAIPALLPPSLTSSQLSSSSNPCFSFNIGRCFRHPCKFPHTCNYCGGAHARLVCPILKANKKIKKLFIDSCQCVSNCI